jgi:FtsZ-binding cell division protein ZapB
LISLEQIKLLESKVIKALEYIDQLTEENVRLREKLETYQKQIDGLEVVVQHFKEDQGRIEEGIVSALNRLNRFEADIEKSLALEKIREDPIPGKAAQSNAKDTPKLHEGKEDGDGQHGVSHDSSSVITEEKTEDVPILKSGTDGLSGNEETSDEALNPGELDIF